MPSLITHHIFGEDAAQRLPEGLVDGEEELLAFLLGNEGPDPFFVRFRTIPALPHVVTSRMTCTPAI